MAKKPTLTTVSSGFNSTTTLNNNFIALRDAFDNTLSLDGSTPNAMNADLDMNSNDLLNVGEVDTESLRINGVLVAPSSVVTAPDANVVNYNQGGTSAVNRTVANKLRESVSVKDFGAVGDGVTDDRDAIQNALNAAAANGGGMVIFENGKTYAVGSTTRPYLSLPSNVGMDLNWSTLQRIGTNYTVPFIENANVSGSVTTENHIIRNGIIRGTGAVGQTSDQGAAVLMFNSDNVVIENITTENTNGDGLSFRLSGRTLIKNCVIGDYGRNGISPTSGDFTYRGLTISGSAISGANPGIAFDAENDGSAERGTHRIYDISCEDMTFVDFFASSGGSYGHDIFFYGGTVGPKFLPFRILASNPVIADKIFIGPNVKITCTGNSGAAIQIRNVTGAKITGAQLIRDPAATGSPSAISTALEVADLDVSAVYCDPAFAFGVQQVSGTLEDSTFTGCNLGNVRLLDATGLRFSASQINTLTLADVAVTGNTFDLGTDVNAIVVSGTGDASLQDFNVAERAIEIRETATTNGGELNFRGRQLFSAQEQGIINFFPDGYPQFGSQIQGYQPASLDTADLRFFTTNSTRGERLRIQENGATRPGADNTLSLGTASFRWSQLFAGTTVINTSDEREKEQIEEIPDAWLDAWGDVQWARFRFKDAVAIKGDGARWHTGLVAQRVQEAFAARGLNALEIGLLCYDAWDEVTEPVYAMRTNPETGEQEEYDTGEVRVITDAGNRFGVRYNEAQAMEAAWVRRELKKIIGA